MGGWPGGDRAFTVIDCRLVGVRPELWDPGPLMVHHALVDRSADRGWERDLILGILISVDGLVACTLTL